MTVPQLQFMAEMVAAKMFFEPTFINTWKYKERLFTLREEAEENLNETCQVPHGLKPIILRGITRIYQFYMQIHWCVKKVNFENQDSLAHILKADEESDYFIYNFMTNTGRFDELKLIVQLVNDPNCDEKMRFILACNYCLEEYIRQHWKQFEHEEFNKYGWANLWLNEMKNPSNSWPNLLESNSYRVHQHVIAYVWNKLTDDQRSSYVNNTEKFVTLIYECCETSVPFLLSVLSGDKLTEVIEHISRLDDDEFEIFIVCGLLNPRSTDFFQSMMNKYYPTYNRWELMRYFGVQIITERYDIIDFEVIWEFVKNSAGQIDVELLTICLSLWLRDYPGSFRLIVEDMTSDLQQQILDECSSIINSRKWEEEEEQEEWDNEERCIVLIQKLHGAIIEQKSKK